MKEKYKTMFNPFKPKPYVEICRSFSLKKNLGNYESADLFCSAKRECLPEEAEEMSEKLLSFCRREVAKDLKQFAPKEDPKPIKEIPKGASLTTEDIDFS